MAKRPGPSVAISPEVAASSLGSTLTRSRPRPSSGVLASPPPGGASARTPTQPSKSPSNDAASALFIARCSRWWCAPEPRRTRRQDGTGLLLAGEPLVPVRRPLGLAPAEPEATEGHITHEHRTRGEQHRAPQAEQHGDALGAALDQGALRSETGDVAEQEHVVDEAHGRGHPLEAQR